MAFRGPNTTVSHIFHLDRLISTILTVIPACEVLEAMVGKDDLSIELN